MAISDIINNAIEQAPALIRSLDSRPTGTPRISPMATIGLTPEQVLAMNQGLQREAQVKQAAQLERERMAAGQLESLKSREHEVKLMEKEADLRKRLQERGFENDLVQAYLNRDISMEQMQQEHRNRMALEGARTEGQLKAIERRGEVESELQKEAAALRPRTSAGGGGSGSGARGMDPEVIHDMAMDRVRYEGLPYRDARRLAEAQLSGNEQLISRLEEEIYGSSGSAGSAAGGFQIPPGMEDDSDWQRAAKLNDQGKPLPADLAIKLAQKAQGGATRSEDQEPSAPARKETQRDLRSQVSRTREIAEERIRNKTYGATTYLSLAAIGALDRKLGEGIGLFIEALIQDGKMTIDAAESLAGMVLERTQ